MAGRRSRSSYPYSFWVGLERNEDGTWTVHVSIESRKQLWAVTRPTAAEALAAIAPNMAPFYERLAGWDAELASTRAEPPQKVPS